MGSAISIRCRPPEEQRVEVLCNRVAAGALMPRERLLFEDIVIERGSESTAWTDEDIKELAKRYSISREAVLRLC